jgi:hypothetical protein
MAPWRVSAHHFPLLCQVLFSSSAGKAEPSISLSKGGEDRDEKQASISLVFPERMAWGIYRILCLWKAP